jgi:hypothetical protein
MTLTADHGQKLTAPAGKVIGFFDGKAEFEAFAKAAALSENPKSLRREF